MILSTCRSSLRYLIIIILIHVRVIIARLIENDYQVDHPTYSEQAKCKHPQ